jgi:hypothetical protein
MKLNDKGDSGLWPSFYGQKPLVAPKRFISEFFAAPVEKRACVSGTLFPNGTNNTLETSDTTSSS